MPYKFVIEKTKEIEFILEESYGANGRGLHAKATSVEDMLHSSIIKK